MHRALLHTTAGLISLGVVTLSRSLYLSCFHHQIDQCGETSGQKQRPSSPCSLNIPIGHLFLSLPTHTHTQQQIITMWPEPLDDEGRLHEPSAMLVGGGVRLVALITQPHTPSTITSTHSCTFFCVPMARSAVHFGAFLLALALFEVAAVHGFPQQQSRARGPHPVGQRAGLRAERPGPRLPRPMGIMAFSSRVHLSLVRCLVRSMPM